MPRKMLPYGVPRMESDWDDNIAPPSKHAKIRRPGGRKPDRRIYRKLARSRAKAEVRRMLDETH